MPLPQSQQPQQQGPKFPFELPNGAMLHLQSVEEVEYLTQSADMLTADYTFEKYNDRVLLGALLSQQLNLYRAQQTLTMPIGKGPGYVSAEMSRAASKTLLESAEEIRDLEKALGIDKKTREQGGSQTLQAYITNLQRVAHEYGVHVTERVKRYEQFVADLSVKMRLLDNADAEDRAHHNISEATILDFVRESIEELTEFDRQFAKQKGKLWLGRL